jgi:Thiamine pyrophosphate enzyme, C-terminal TPP binding domain
VSAAGGGLGFGLPATVGAQLAAPDLPVTAIMGDGSMHYAITALWTAAAYNIPLTIIVLYNAEYGIHKMFGDIEHTKGVPGLDIPGLDIVATAQSYGVQAHSAKSTEELEHLFREAVLDRDRPTLIDVPIVPVHAGQHPVTGPVTASPTRACAAAIRSPTRGLLELAHDLLRGWPSGFTLSATTGPGNSARSPTPRTPRRKNSAIGNVAQLPEPHRRPGTGT